MSTAMPRDACSMSAAFFRHLLCGTSSTPQRTTSKYMYAQAAGTGACSRHQWHDSRLMLIQQAALHSAAGRLRSHTAPAQPLHALHPL